MLKSVIRRSIRAVKRWVEEPHAQADPNADPKSSSPFVFPKLNATAQRIADQLGARQRSSYTWGVVCAAHVAKALGIRRISAIELGVAGGNGLLALDCVAPIVGRLFDVEVHVFGFDTGQGLPKPEDYRDLPNIYRPGRHPMDEAKLRSQLRSAQLRLGLVKETIPQFIRSSPPPIGFIAFDLDLYTSTRDSMAMLDASTDILMPRIYTYFDDIMGLTFSDFNGERLAISEFNRTREMRKISPIYGLRFFMGKRWANAMWAEMYYMVHIFDHPLYGADDGFGANRHYLGLRE